MLEMQLVQDTNGNTGQTPDQTYINIKNTSAVVNSSLRPI